MRVVYPSLFLLAAGVAGCGQAKEAPAFTMEGEGAGEVMAYIRQEGGLSQWFPTATDCTLVRIEPTPQLLDGQPLASNIKELTASWTCERVKSPLRVSFKLTDKKVSAVFPHYGK